ncbi:SusC/RagA family TonB-linked outer membrane protein [Puia dinghuensis]|uniref:SusC/RagA family TonB-linked outer membrane protein n=1 Tax=Puia dinghuensis TaxID=1792502 RepID=A0A8J2XWG9_9BACT|nr:SusC/RagA family TonB-linked outer membrane protein [Puia dinghuensis]GGB23720.1 SusC/RagA family TonB-linked outer membrane protein [Puia dinghuensis]
MTPNSNGMPHARAIAGYDPLEALKAAKLATRERHDFKGLLRVVKLTALFLFVGLLQLSAGSSGQRLSIAVKNTTLDKLFSEIEKKTSYVFFYDATLLQHTRPVTVDMKDATIEEVLAYSLKGQGLAFSIQDRTIFVKREQAKTAGVGTAEGGGATPGVKGEVRSEEGLPLAGATVYIKKLKISGMTDAKGEFELKNVPDGEYEVEISYVGFEGYKTMVSVTNHVGTVTAKLKQSMSKLDETVVKGYYNTTNRLNTGSVFTVKAEDIEKQPVTDPLMALEGRVPGLYIAQTSGIPGSYGTVLLRGQNFIFTRSQTPLNLNSPLYIVDGVPFSSTSLTSNGIGGGALGSPSNGPNPQFGMSPFNNLNPADIESIEVLKDADATAIYGSRGANGVVLITTKKGKAGSTRVDVNVYSGAGKVAREMQLLNTQQYLAMRHQAFYNDSLSSPSSDITPGPNDYDLNGIWDTTRYTDWQKVFIGGTAQLTSANLNISGGNLNTQFLIGGNYTKQTTVYPGDFSDQKASVHININHASIDQKFHLLFSGQYMNDNSMLPSTDFATDITMAPDAPALYNADGSINWQGGTWYNPLASILMTSGAVTHNLLGNLNLSYELLPGLKIKSSLGYTRMQMDQTQLIPSAAFYGPPDPNNRFNFFATTSVGTWVLEPEIDYSKKLGQGKLDILIGTTFQENVQNTLGQYAYGFSSDALISDIAAASNVATINATNSDYRYNALFGRAGYNWRDKYLINITARRDGSTRFGPQNQFGNFGSAGVGWIFSKENFAEKLLPVLSFGKLRISYGVTGNDQINDYQYFSTYAPYSRSSYQGVIGLYPQRIANPYFGWERVNKLEAGIELGFLKDRVLLSGDYYRNRSNNQLVLAPLPSIDGFSSIQSNLPALVQNSGAEVEINTVNIKTKNFTWTTAFNLTIPRNKLVSFPGLASNSTYKNAYEIGKSLFIQHQYHYTGVDPQTGLFTFQDVNKDGVINSLDLQFLKQVAQEYYGGFGNTFIYKEFQLTIFFQYVRQTGFNYFADANPTGIFNGGSSNVPVFMVNNWKRPGDVSNIEQFTQGGGSGAAATAWYNIQTSDYAIGDASFIRLKNLSLSWSLPEQWRRKMHLQNARIYVQGQNLLTITKYRGQDPESPTNQGLTLPPLRMITGGVQLTL